MAQTILQDLDAIRQRILKSCDASLLDNLDTRFSEFSCQVTVQKELNRTSYLVQQKQSLPVRRIGYNIRSLLEHSRWTRISELDFDSLIFCIVSFQGLGKMPEGRFAWLLRNIPDYLQMQPLPPEWFLTKQIHYALNPGREDGEVIKQSWSFFIEFEIRLLIAI